MRTRGLLVEAGLIVWALICAIPVVLLVLASVKEVAVMRAPLDMLMSAFTFDNYRRIINAGILVQFRNSVIISTASIVLTILLAAPLAFGLTKLPLRLKNMLAFAILGVRFVPYVSMALPLFLVFLILSMTGTISAVILAHLTIHIPFGTWLLLGFFEGIPSEIEDAAVVDGCSSFRYFWSIAMPMNMSGLASLTILVFILSWNEYLFALFLSGANSQPLTVGLARYMGGVEAGAEYGALTAYASLTALPVVVIAMFLSRYVISGLTTGGTKG